MRVNAFIPVTRERRHKFLTNTRRSRHERLYTEAAGHVTWCLRRPGTIFPPFLPVSLVSMAFRYSPSVH
jgi:hypothetical protein